MKAASTPRRRFEGGDGSIDGRPLRGSNSWEVGAELSTGWWSEGQKRIDGVVVGDVVG